MKAQTVKLGILTLAFLSMPVTSNAGDAPKLVTLVLSGPPSTYMAPYYVAEDAGFYSDAGLKVAITTISGDQNALRAVLSGSGDVAVIGFPILYEAVNSGARIKAIGTGVQCTVDYYLVLGRGKGDSLKDAADKVLAISTPGSMPQLIPQILFAEKHIDASKARYVAVGGNAARLQAVVAGKVDGTLIDTLNAVRGEKDGQLKIVADAATDVSTQLAFSVGTVSDSALADPERRAKLAAFVLATIKGARLVSENPEMAAKSVDERLKGDTPMDLMVEVFKRINQSHVWGLNGGIPRKLHDDTIALYTKFNLVSKPVSYEDAFDPSLADDAVKTLGPVPGSN
jgi:ABC-type nitrate/sulfonate/bicarbonate transport system substrate-binding protein